MEYPLILQLDKSGNARRWITYEKAAYHYAKDQVIYELGSSVTLLHGGINVQGIQSTLQVNSIIAIHEKNNSSKKVFRSPVLTNKILFRRDGYICAYCGHKFTYELLTRDHIIAKSNKGSNSWNNVITACKKCNSYKGSKTINQLQWTLKYEPYVPTHEESLFVKNLTMLDDQYSFLINVIPLSSRIHQFYTRITNETI